MSLRRILSAPRVAALVLVAPLAVIAQGKPASDSSKTDSLGRVTITATRRPTDTREVAPAVSVIESQTLGARLPNSPADALREEPGVDVSGTGPNQGRPIIRGQRGQRILLLEDGLRLNNSRRQQDFGELPALVDVSQIDRIEVVRGPASVLYGTDAIGGVVNLITRSPVLGGNRALHGNVGYEYGSAGTLGKTGGVIRGSSDSWGWDLGGSARVAGDYDAPKGSYGNVHLADKTPLQLSGVRDHNWAGAFGWKNGGGNTLVVRAEQYVADNAGFGYVPPSQIGGDPTVVQIRYPHQDFRKLSAAWTSAALGADVADRVEVRAYVQDNKRDLAQHIFAPFGPGTPPGAGADINTWNYTDLQTRGLRAEATKVSGLSTWVYGVDFFTDHSHGTDTSATTVIGFGPPQTQSSNRPQVPDADLSSYGAFLQGDFRVHDRVDLILGTRSQIVESAPQATPGRTDPLTSHSNSTIVYAANAVWRATDQLSVVATLGRGFRSPNLVERYFDGPTPEGSAYQQASPDLRAETSLNFDGGLKWRSGMFGAEATVFKNDIHDAIQTAPTGAKQGTLPVYTNVNVGTLSVNGVELGADASLGGGFRAGASYSTVKSKNVLQPNSPIGDTYASKLVGTVGWTSSTNRFWAEYVVRQNGDQKDIATGASPVGSVLPAFTVMGVRGGIRGWQVGTWRQDLTVQVNNLGNVLYAEAANAGFFRPEPGRNVVVAIATSF